MLVPTLGMSSYVNLPVLDSFHLRCHDLTAIYADRKRGQIAGWFQQRAYINLPMGYRLGVVLMTSRDRMTS